VVVFRPEYGYDNARNSLEKTAMGSKRSAAWKMFVILSGRGGVGKTLLAALLTVALLLQKRSPRIVEADLQKRLQLLFPGRVTIIDIDRLEALEEDPLALARVFAAIPQAAREAASAIGADVILDTAATWHLPIIKYASEIQLPEQVMALNGELVFLVPLTADADAILLAIDTAQKIEQLLPKAELVFVRNEYPQPPRFDLPALLNVQDELKRLFRDHRQIRLPAIHEKIWGNFERAGMSVLDVSAAAPSDLIDVAKADVDTVVLMQGRVEAWMNSFIEEVQPLLHFRDGSTE
jgi:hypothetical protein